MTDTTEHKFLLFVNASDHGDKEITGSLLKSRLAYLVGEIPDVTVEAAWFQPYALWTVTWTGGYEQPSYWGTNMKEAAVQRYEEWTAQAKDGDDVRLLRIDPGTGDVTDETPHSKDDEEVNEEAVDLARQIAEEVTSGDNTQS